MMARQSKPSPGEAGPPTSYPQTPPPSTGGNDPWVLTAINKMEGSLGKLEASAAATQLQLARIETKLNEIEKDVRGHGNWMHTLKAFAAFMALILGFVFVNAVWPWLKAKIGIPTTTP